MKPIQNRIYPLDTVSQSKIRSSTRISCLNEIVVELVKNALDAKAKSINVVLNYAIGFCSVQDDGCGISAQEFADDGNLAENYHTSKLNGSPTLYGQYGRHLAAISGIALLSVSSRHDDEHVHTLWVNDTGRLGHYVEEGNDWHVLHGTRVRVYNLFAKFPVRRKHLAQYFASSNATERELDKLKHDLTGLIFAFPGGFDLDVRHTKSCCIFRRKYFGLSTDLPDDQHIYRDSKTVSSVLQQLGYTERTQVLDWQNMTVSSQAIHVQAVVSSMPSPHKLVQFISVNQRPLKKQTHAALFDIVNSVFDLSTFGAPVLGRNTANELQAEDESGSVHSKQIMAHKKGIDRWPMFIVWLDTRAMNLDAFCDDAASAEVFEKLVSRVSVLLKTMFTEFLTNNGYKPLHRMKQRTQHKPMEPIADQSTLAVNWSNHSFGDWSRIKSSREFAMEDILSGLPFQRSKDGQAKLSDGGPALQEGDHLITVELPHRSGRLKDSAGKDVVKWIDPQTRQTTSIDPRTGIVFPDFESFPVHSQVIAHRSKRRKTTSFAQVAQNAKKHRSLRNDNETPVCSIALFTDPADKLDNSWQAESKLERQFGRPCSTRNLQNGRRNVLKISKSALKNLAVLGQVDKKFILGLVPYVESTSSHTAATDCQLVLVDQHAADERVKVEQLIRCFFDKIITLANPIIFKTSAREAKLLELHKSYFDRFHIVYDVTSYDHENPVDDTETAQMYRVNITELPEVIAERCRLQPKIIIDLLREEVWSDVENSSSSSATRAKMHKHHHTPERIHTQRRDITIASDLPARVLNLLNSRACRSAIMFNDELTQSQCASLVSSLAECTLPFQCAHGRPSVVTLTEWSSFTVHDPLASNEAGLHDLRLDPSKTTSSHLQSHGLNSIDGKQSFGNAYKNWVEEGQS